MRNSAQQLLFGNETATTSATGFRAVLTFKANRGLGRHGWLRLTPAYSRHLVETLVSPLTSAARVLDPFCGTGTTALTCAEHGIRADTVDINPFLVWLANVKFAAYAPTDICAAQEFALSLQLHPHEEEGCWRPPLKDIQKWWDERDLRSLAGLLAAIKRIAVAKPARDLLFSAFCRVAIETAAVSFGHQSMSFKARETGSLVVDIHEPSAIKALFRRRLKEVLAAAESPLDGGLARAVSGDSRRLDEVLGRRYSAVITSPPYPNRMSYIRELRPYMYWLGYLADGRQAGELDWQAIGGTWGCATSNLMRWAPDPSVPVPFPGLPGIVERIAERSRILSIYVHKYFEDCVLHFRSLAKVLRKGATAHYIVGNSKFYDVMLPTELIYAEIMRQHGFVDVAVENIRKRTSKKELFEFIVNGRFAG